MPALTGFPALFSVIFFFLLYWNSPACSVVQADVTVTRLVNRVLVYGLESGLPMLFDCDGRGTEIYPTVFALWLVPDLLPSFLLKGGEVSRYVLSGADLMAPGVQVRVRRAGADLMAPGVQVPAEGLPAFRPGEVWSVKVGITMVGSADAVGAGMRGKLLRITHYYRDSLWETAEGSYVPNKGFLPGLAGRACLCAACSPALMLNACAIPFSSAPTHAHRETAERSETAEGSYVPNRGFLPDLVVPNSDATPALLLQMDHHHLTLRSLPTSPPETSEGSYVPNKGFLPDLVVPDPDAEPVPSDGAAPEDSPGGGLGVAGAGEGEGEAGQGEGRGDEGGEAGAVMEEGAAAAASSEQLSESPQHLGMHDTAAAAAASADTAVGGSEGDQRAAAAAAEETAESAAAMALTPAQMDELLDRSLLQALSVSVKPAHLPLGASTLWSNHVLPCRPPGTTVDIKKSSHKKLSKWLHAKAVDGLISGKEDKHRKEFIMSAINYRHPTLIAFLPDKTNKPAQTPAAATLDASPAAPGAPTTTTATTTTTTSSGSGSSSSGGGLTVEEVFKPTHHVSAIFEAVGLDPHAYYSPSAAREAALNYISLHSLTKPSDPSIVILDAPLCDALYKGAIKKGAAYPTECHKRDVGPTLVRRMQAHHRVERAGKSVVRKGGLVPVQILVERRQGNKKVTRVSGLEAYLVEAEPLAAELQRKFASSTSVAEVPGERVLGGWGQQVQGATGVTGTEWLIWWRLTCSLLSCRGISLRALLWLKCQVGLVGVQQVLGRWGVAHTGADGWANWLAYLVEAEALAAELQRKFASSTGVSGKKGQQEVRIQGGVLYVHLLPFPSNALAFSLYPPFSSMHAYTRIRQEGAAGGADSGRGSG
ncbi:unnamed protein product [Closterium sp. NIES-65]|nr:unnamed protein product [Closterium sp. NIES-65]